MVNAKVKRTKKNDREIEQMTGISREVHECRNGQINEQPTGKLRASKDNDMIYVDEAVPTGREWHLQNDFAASYHQPTLGCVRAFINSILDCVIFCVDFPVPNMKFISENDDKTWSEVICNRYTGELVVDPRIIGTGNWGASGSLDHIHKDMQPHEKYGAHYRHIYKGMDIHYYDNRPLPVILAEPLGGKKAKYVSPENDPNDPKYIQQQPKKETESSKDQQSEENEEAEK